jgi:uroporphyrinogen decarboxylase
MAQIEAGAQAVMIFDTWGGALGHAEYREFSLAYMQQVLRRPDAGTGRDTRAEHSFHEGWRRVARSHRRERVRRGRDRLDRSSGSARGAWAHARLQGNLEPAVLLAEAGRSGMAVASVLSDYGHGSGHIFNLGHGVSRFTPPRTWRSWSTRVHEQSRSYH